MTIRDEIVAAARECKGTPFRRQGRRPGPDGALDCAGVIRHAGVTAGGVAADYDHRNYSAFPKPAEIAAELNRMMDRVGGGLEAARDGDVVMLVDARWSHTGILASHNGARTLIHTTRTDRHCVEHHLTEEWARRVAGVWRFRRIGYEGAEWHNSR